MKGNLYTISYAAALGLVSAVLLTAAANLTRPYREANEQAEKIWNVLTVLGAPLEAGLSSKELVEIFEANIREERLGDRTMYVYYRPETPDKAEAFAVEFLGSGMWGPLKGFLAMESDWRTVRGISFYHQEETPGLGGEIASEWFRGRFAGKSIVDETGRPGLIIQGTGNTAPHRVDAISGATMTCEKVQAALQGAIETIIKESGKNGR